MLEGKRLIVAELVAKGSTFLGAVLEAGYEKTLAASVADRLCKDEEVVEFINNNSKLAAKTVSASAWTQSASVEDSDEESDEPTKFAMGKTKINDPKRFLTKMMNNPHIEDRLRADIAKALLPYHHGKVGDMGKKETKKKAAEEAAKGKFGTSNPPKLKPNLTAVK